MSLNFCRKHLAVPVITILVLLIFSFSAQQASAGTTAAGSDVEAQIIDGQRAEIGRYPYVVRLAGIFYGEKYTAPFCSGVLIAPRYILTAAHCVAEMPWEYQSLIRKSDLFVRFVNTEERRRISVVRTAYWRDANFWDNISQSDLAVLQLAEDAPVAPARLSALTDSMAQAPLRVLGYGLTIPGDTDEEMSDYLMYGDMVNASGSRCRDPQGARIFYDREICAASRPPQFISTICNGDSGGPLMSTINEAIVGISSWGPDQYCDTVVGRRFAVFARVSAARAWLMRQTGAPLFGQGAISQNLRAPLSPKTTIVNLNPKRAVVKLTAGGSWRRAALFVTSKATIGGRQRDSEMIFYINRNSSTTSLALPRSWDSSQTKGVMVSIVARFTNEIDNGTTAPEVSKSWKR